MKKLKLIIKKLFKFPRRLLGYLNKNFFIFVAIIALLGLAFYWYEWRPSQIKKTCHANSVDSAIETFKSRIELKPSYEITTAEKQQMKDGWYMKNDVDDSYKNCLRGEGL